MMKFRQLLFISVLVTGIFQASSVMASGFYVAPRAGALMQLDEENTDTTLGAAFGYRWVKLLALEASYQRVFASGDDNNLLELNAVVTGHRGALWPYFNAGDGTAISTANNADPELTLRLGGGAMLRLLDYVRPFAQLNYVNIGTDTHFIEPSVGITFGL